MYMYVIIPAWALTKKPSSNWDDFEQEIKHVEKAVPPHPPHRPTKIIEKRDWSKNRSNEFKTMSGPWAARLKNNTAFLEYYLLVRMVCSHVSIIVFKYLWHPGAHDILAETKKIYPLQQNPWHSSLIFVLSGVHDIPADTSKCWPTKSICTWLSQQEL